MTCERGIGAIIFIGTKVCVLDSNLGREAHVKGRRCLGGASVHVIERDHSHTYPA